MNALQAAAFLRPRRPFSDPSDSLPRSVQPNLAADQIGCLHVSHFAFSQESRLGPNLGQLDEHLDRLNHFVKARPF